MRNKKGFVLIETIITITVLAASLLYVYSNFNSILIKEKTRIHYDDVAYVYRTHYVKEFFKKYELNYVTTLLDEDNPLIIVGCDYEGIFREDEAAKSFCHNFTGALNIQRIAVAINDFSYINDECKNNNTIPKCSYLNNFSIEERNYLKSLGKMSDTEEYILVIEYLIEDAANNYDIERNFAWISIKGAEEDE